MIVITVDVQCQKLPLSDDWVCEYRLKWGPREYGLRAVMPWSSKTLLSEAVATLKKWVASGMEDYAPGQQYKVVISILP